VTHAADKPASRQSNVLLVDDHPMVRERLAEVLNREPDLRVCAEAEDRTKALDQAERCQPDLAIVDITLKNSNGLELVKDLKARWPHLKVLVVSMHEETLYAERAIRVGAQGYITKQEATRNILLAVRRVLAGGIYLSESSAGRILGRLANHKQQAVTAPQDVLADRELQVFELIGRGVSTREIATRLNIGVKTVETYRSRIREKLSLPEASDLLQHAISWTHQGK
jgi:DNA-binding NarL/FixJ family response regulator